MIIRLLILGDPRADKNKYIKRARFNLENKLGVVLSKGICIHHIDRNPSNDNVNNLMIFPNLATHTYYHRSIRNDW